MLIKYQHRNLVNKVGYNTIAKIDTWMIENPF
jgi:hypothetical protein